MKKLKLILFFILVTYWSSNAQKTSFSKEVLADTFLASSGNQVTLQDILSKHKGKTVLIDVWASWDPDCIKAIPKTIQLQTENPGVDCVFICIDKKPENWKAAIEKNGLKGDHYLVNNGLKGVFIREIELDWIPRFMIINAAGQIVLYRGIETDFDKINALLKK
jgi:thiol-disulfide isomerase/thioredoxin